MCKLCVNFVCYKNKMSNYEIFKDRNSETNQDHDFNAEHFVPLKLNESWAGRRLLEALSQLPPHNLSSSLDVSIGLN